MDNLVVKDLIQKGTFGKVYIGYYYNQRVAVKKIKKERLKKYKIDPQQEIDILNKLNSKFIVGVINFFEDKRYIYHVLEYIETDLFTIIKYQNIDNAIALDYVKKICKGLVYLHLMNIAHLDIKPENILVDKYNNTKICDFSHSIMFKEGQFFNKYFLGTVYYIAPEMVFMKPYDYRVDIWALGIVYYELIEKFPPFFSRDDEEVIYLIKKCELKFSDYCSRKSQRNILKLLNPNPNLRINLLNVLDFTC